MFMCLLFVAASVGERWCNVAGRRPFFASRHANLRSVGSRDTLCRIVTNFLFCFLQPAQKATQSRRNQTELAASDDKPAEADGAEVQIIGNIFNNPDEALAASSSSKAAFGAVPQFDLTPRFSKPGQRWPISEEI